MSATRRVPLPSIETLRPPTFCLRASLKLDREFDHAGSRGRLRQRLVLRRSQLIRDWVEGVEEGEFEQEMEEEEEAAATEGAGGGEGGRGLMDFHAAIRTAVPWKLVRGSIMQHCVQF